MNCQVFDATRLNLSAATQYQGDLSCLEKGLAAPWMRFAVQEGRDDSESRPPIARS